MRRRCPPTCGRRTARSSTARCRASPSRIGRHSASRATRRRARAARPEAALRALQSSDAAASPDPAPPGGGAGAPSGGKPLMPKRTDIQSILIIGAGPIIIGQACEFDYSGAQACKALREEGYRVILVNSNPATIMTDPEMADAIYIEPVNWRTVARIIEKERPDALLPTMGGRRRSTPRSIWSVRACWRNTASSSSPPPGPRSTWPRTASSSATPCARSVSRRRARRSRAASMTHCASQRTSATRS